MSSTSTYICYMYNVCPLLHLGLSLVRSFLPAYWPNRYMLQSGCSRTLTATINLPPEFLTLYQLAALRSRRYFHDRPSPDHFQQPLSGVLQFQRKRPLCPSSSRPPAWTTLPSRRDELVQGLRQVSLRFAVHLSSVFYYPLHT